MLLYELSLAAHFHSVLRFPMTKKKKRIILQQYTGLLLIYLYIYLFICWEKYSDHVSLTLDAMALSFPSREGFVYTTSSSMSASFSPSITAQLSATGISHSLLADITSREYLYSNLAQRQVTESILQEFTRRRIMSTWILWCDGDGVAGETGSDNNEGGERKR